METESTNFSYPAPLEKKRRKIWEIGLIMFYL